MSDKNKKNKKRYSFTKKKGSTVTILPTGAILEKTIDGEAVKVDFIDPDYYVTDAEVVKPPKRPSFFISETLVKARKRLWKLL